MGTILGIDPGSVSGAWAMLYDDGTLTAGDLPVVNRQVDPAALADLILRAEISRAVVEQVGAMPKQGVSSTFAFGRSFGCILGVLGALGVRTDLVTPARWKKSFSLNADKELSRARAIQRFPGAATYFTRKKDAGRAEAAFLALYGELNP